jgi:hypothetical protein
MNGSDQPAEINARILSARADERMTVPMWRSAGRPVFLSLLLYTLIILLATIPTWDVYMWWGHYMLFPVVDVYEICKIWSAEGFGHVPWFPDYCFGYGYPYLTLYGPLGFYIGAIFHFFLGLDYGPATKLSYYTSLYLSGLFVYAFVYTIGSRERWPRLAWWALAAATIYALTRYHLTDIFVRSVMGESWAWATVPGVYWGMELTRHRRLQGLLLTSVMYAGLLLSHNITALWASPFIAIYPLLTVRGVKWPLTVAASGILGTALSAFFWYPALQLAKFTQKAGDVAAMWGTPKHLHWQSIFWRQYFVEALGYGARIPGTDDTLGVNLGFVVLICVILSVIAVFQRGLRAAQRQRLALFILLTFLVLFIMSPQMPWGRIPAVFRYLQFPWRLLIFTAFFGAAAVAMASPVIDRWIHPAVLTGLAVIFAIPTLPMILMPPVIKQMSPERLVNWNRRWERKGIYAGTAEAEFTPKWVRGDYLKPLFLAENPIPANRLTTTSGDLVCDSYMHRGCVYEYNYKASVDSAARIAVFYWPGWELLIDGKVYRDSLKPGDDGLLLASFPAGSHRAELHYNLSPEGKSARMVSTAAAGLWICILFVAMFWGRKESCKIAPATDHDEDRNSAREDAVGSSAAAPPEASA